MDKSAEFIRNKEFHIIFKGYKPEEVDKFLDVLSLEFDRLIRKNRELQESLDRLKFEDTQEDTDIKKIIQDALVSAHRVAEEIKTQAKKEAAEIIEKRKIEEEKSLSDLQLRKLQVEENMIILQGKYDEFKSRVKKMIEEFGSLMSVIDQEMSREVSMPEKQEDPGETEIYREDSRGNEYKNKEIDFNTETPDDEAAKKESNFNKEVIQKTEDMETNIQDEINNTEKNYSEKEKGKPADNTYENNNEMDDQQDSGLKRQRKKIDIANPDIIENFFRTDEDRNY